MGGLGNQLFQIFASFAYCIRNYNLLILPYSELLETGKVRKTYWNNILSSFKELTTFGKNVQFTNDQLYEFVRYREIGHHYNEIPYDLNTNIMFFGYFQSYKYFEKEKDQIFSFIKSDNMKKKVLDEYPEYLFKNQIAISMHFRLGDYKDISHIHPILPYEYYYNALYHLLLHIEINKPIVVLYFCEEEDNDNVKKIIDKLSDKFISFTFVKVNDSIDDWKQMLIMSNCYSNIIANSSFSWWGAYFNSNPDKIVCYPSLWFGKSVKNNMDSMFPTEWIKISIET